MHYAIDKPEDEWSLSEVTVEAIRMLDNPNGFFMMVEGGKIDWTCHTNDARTSIDDTIAFDNAVAEAVKFAESHPGEVLIVVTADHVEEVEAFEGAQIAPPAVAEIEGQRSTVVNQQREAHQLRFAEKAPRNCPFQPNAGAVCRLKISH